MPVRIVLVEDNPADVLLVEKALEARGIDCELIRYEDGEQAIRALTEEDEGAPDLILLDLNLPRVEGFDVLKAIRGRPALVSVPVGILTSSETQADRHRVGLLGAERYIHKPHNLEEFLHTVGTAVEELLSTC